MALPRSVQEQAERAEQLQQQLINGKQEPAPAPAEMPAAPQEATPAPEPAATPIENPAPVPELPASEPAPAPAPKGDDWENRFKGLQRRYNADIASRDARIGGLENQLQQLQATVEQLKQPQQPKPSLIKPEEVEEYGEGLVDLVKRAAQEVSTDVVSAKDAEISQLRGELNQVKQETIADRQSRYFTDLSDSCPEWESINTNPDFLQWLNEVDPYSGFTRQHLLTTAHQQLSAGRVANFFNTWKQAQVPQEPAASPDAALEEHIAPPASAAPATPPQGKKTYTRAEIDAAYKDIAAKLRRGEITLAEADAEDQKFMAAIQEGRVKA